MQWLPCFVFHNVITFKLYHCVIFTRGLPAHGSNTKIILSHRHERSECLCDKIIVLWAGVYWMVSYVVIIMGPCEPSTISLFSVAEPTICRFHDMTQNNGKRGERWYHSIIHYNDYHYKGSYGRPESHISLILDYQFCACVMRTSGVPQLQVIHMEHLYDYK